MIRADSLLKDTPVILLTARAAVDDKVKGLESGADDYVAKPFEPREILLRVQALLRRAKSAASATKTSVRLAAGPVVLDIEKHEVTVGGDSVELTATEFKLLRLLIERKGRVQTRDALLSDVWNYEAELETRTVDTHVRRLREKLGAGSEIIETLRGVGYRVSAS
jgi:two-component system phosphate regulon response regulator PhoB